VKSFSYVCYVMIDEQLTPLIMSLVEIVSEYVVLSSVEMETLRDRFSSVSSVDDVMEIIHDMFPTLDRLSTDGYDDMRQDFLEIL
jgi:hypothetical protein